MMSYYFTMFSVKRVVNFFRCLGPRAGSGVQFQNYPRERSQSHARDVPKRGRLIPYAASLPLGKTVLLHIE
jgi:hypothetical protein